MMHGRADLGDATLISRNPGILTAEVDDEIVMLSIENGLYFGLDEIGRDIWKRIEPPCRFRDLVDGLVRDYNADRTIIAADTRELLLKMAAHHVVSLN